MAHIVVAAAVIGVLGVGAGFGFGLVVPSRMGESVPTAKEVGGTPVRHGLPEWERAPSEVAKGGGHIVTLDPIIVNLSGGSRKWIRVEGAVEFLAPPGSDAKVLVAEMMEDIAGYLRGTTLEQLGSFAGFEFLREDLAEIVRLRSRNAARRFIVRTLVVE